jgi:hypothetical protein
MVAQIIGSLVILLVIYVFYKAGSGFIENDNLLGKFFPIGSGVVALFLLSLIWFS